MKIKNLSSILMLLLPLGIFLACRKNSLNVVETVEKTESKMNTISTATSCSGTESHMDSFYIESNPNYFSRINISKIRVYYCNNFPIGTDTLVKILQDYYQGTEDTEPGPTIGLSNVVPGYQMLMTNNCSQVYFNSPNIVHYNSNYFETRVADAAMLNAIFDAVSAFQYQYSGSINLSDFDGQYGQGSTDKLIYAVFGHFCAEAFGTNKFNTWVSNVPATSGFQQCDESRFKQVCLTGASNYWFLNNSSYNEIYEYYANEIAAHRM